MALRATASPSVATQQHQGRLLSHTRCELGWHQSPKPHCCAVQDTRQDRHDSKKHPPTTMHRRHTGRKTSGRTPLVWSQHKTSPPQKRDMCRGEDMGDKNHRLRRKPWLSQCHGAWSLRAFTQHARARLSVVGKKQAPPVHSREVGEELPWSAAALLSRLPQPRRLLQTRVPHSAAGAAATAQTRTPQTWCGRAR